MASKRSEIVNNEALQARAVGYVKFTQALLRRSGMAARLAQGERGARYLSFGYRLGNSLDLDKALKLADKLTLATAVDNVMAYGKQGLVWFDFELRRSHWQRFTRRDVDGLAIGVGPAGTAVEYPLLGGGGYHGLFAGMTGAGKSTAMQSLLYGIAMTVEPSELDLFVIDPHGDYQAFANLPHLAAPVATGVEQISMTLTAVRNIYTRRKAENERGGKRVVVVADEAQDIDFIGTKDEGFNRDNLAAVADLSRGAGKYRVNLVIGSQRPTQKDLPGVISNLQNRFIGKVDNAATGAAVSGQAQTPAHKLSGEGDFLAINTDGFTRFQVAMPTAADLERLPRVETVPMLADVDMLDDRFDGEDVEETAVVGGRPASGFDVDKLGWLMLNSDATDYAAAKRLGVTRYMVGRYRDAAEQLIAMLCRGGFSLEGRC